MSCRHASSRRAGITLVETLLASSLGAALLVALLALYQRGVAANAYAESRSELVETLFIAERVLVDELQNAGRMPCGPRGRRFNLVHTSASTPWLRLFAAPVQVAPAGVGGDEIVVLTVGAPVPLAGHDPAESQLALTHAGEFERGDLVVVCDDAVTVLLQLTRTRDGGRVLGYDAGPRVHPGNCTSPFAVGGCGPEGHRFTDAAFVAPYRPVAFSVKASGGSRSLYRERLVVTKTKNGTTPRMRSEEMTTGVVLLHARTGVADAAGRVRLARGPFAGRAILLDLGLAAVARERSARMLPGKALHLFGESVGALLPPDAASDEYLTADHEFSVAL